MYILLVITLKKIFFFIISLPSSGSVQHFHILQGQRGTLQCIELLQAPSSHFKGATLSCFEPLCAALSPFKFALCCFKLLRDASIHFEMLGAASNCLELL